MTSQDLFYYEQGRGLVSAHIRLFIILGIPFLELNGLFQCLGVAPSLAWHHRPK